MLTLNRFFIENFGFEEGGTLQFEIKTFEVAANIYLCLRAVGRSTSQERYRKY